MVGQRIINDHSFSCSDIAGMEIDSFVGYYDGELNDGIDMVVIKFKEKDLYHRFFLDAGIGFWEEWSEDEAKYDYEEIQEIDLAEKFALRGKRVSKIECFGSFHIFSSFIFEIENNRLEYRYSNKQDVESDTVLSRS